MSSNEFASSRWSPYGAGTLGRRWMSASVPTRVSPGYRRGPAGIQARPSSASPGLRHPLRSRSGRGCRRGALSFGELLPLLFPQTVPGAPEGGTRNVRSRALAAHTGRKMGRPLAQAVQPSPVRSRSPGPRPLSQRRTRSKPSVHLWGAGCLTPTPGPSAFQECSAGARSIP